jgi:hypothetical protein
MEKEKLRRYSLFPRTVAQSVEPLVKPIFKKHGFAGSRILTDWEKIVGPELAACSLPQKISGRAKEGGTLQVLVASGRALELQHMLPVILDNIATYLGCRAVQKIKIVQTSEPVFRKPTKKISAKKHAPSKQLTSLVASCVDSDLREALLSLGSIIERTNS